MSNDIPYGVTIFCDDIRQEIGNKPSYMGIYTGDLIVQSGTPVLLPKLCAAVHLLIPTHMKVAKISLALKQAKGGADTELSRIDMEDVQIPDNAGPGTFSKMHFDIAMSPFVIDGPSLLKMRAYIDDGEEIRLGTLPITVLPPPDQPEANA